MERIPTREQENGMTHTTDPIDQDEDEVSAAETFIEDVDRGWGAWLFGLLVCLVIALIIAGLSMVNRPIG
jgi:hypothetical protein